MQEELNEKISLLIDDELACDKAMSLLKKISDEDQLKSKLLRYQLIGQVLKNEPCYLVDTDFADQIHQKIRQEPTLFLPNLKQKHQFRISKMAIAASVMLAMVWIVSKYNKPDLPEAQQLAAVSASNTQAKAVNARLKEYLQAHDNTAYINNGPNIQPYTQVVGYHQ